jgi:hypothetical protein
MSTRPTKKELNEALKPLFAAYDRYALALMRGERPPVPEAIEWRGMTFRIQLVRRGHVVCNVPAPFSCFEFHYEAFVDGKRVASWPGRPSFIDVVFRWMAANV